jgi:hypothetical protein
MSLLTRHSQPHSNDDLALSKRSTPSTRSWWTWLRRATCSIKPPQSTRQRWRHKCVYGRLRLMISTEKCTGLG